jgi:hypothetical protein
MISVSAGLDVSVMRWELLMKAAVHLRKRSRKHLQVDHGTAFRAAIHSVRRAQKYAAMQRSNAAQKTP